MTTLSFVRWRMGAGGICWTGCIAGALSFAKGEAIDFACWDKELRKAAQEQAFQLIPEHL